MKFKSEIVSAIAQGSDAFSADDDGVIDIPTEHVAKFADLIAAGVLVPAAEAPAVDLATLTKAVEDTAAKVKAAQGKADKATTPAAKATAAKALALAQEDHDAAVAALEDAQA